VGGLVERGAHRAITDLADPAGVVGLAGLMLLRVNPKWAPACFDEVNRAGSSIALA